MESASASRYTDLDFNSPLSDLHASELVATLQPLAHAEIVDLGCGWAELLLRLLGDDATARGVGIDLDPVAVARGRTNADMRRLSDRVRLECADATVWSGLVDIAIAIGASHAWGGTRSALDAIRPLLRAGGRLLLGEGIWEMPPTPAALAALDAEPQEFTTVAGLVDLSVASGFRLLAMSTATLREWDSFESRYCAGRERWLLANPDAPDAPQVRTQVDAHRAGWLHGYRGVLGFAYLTLGV